jgi:hypothetical protein
MTWKQRNLWNLCFSLMNGGQMDRSMIEQSTYGLMVIRWGEIDKDCLFRSFVSLAIRTFLCPGTGKELLKWVLWLASEKDEGKVRVFLPSTVWPSTVVWNAKVPYFRIAWPEPHHSWFSFWWELFSWLTFSCLLTRSSHGLSRCRHLEKERALT